MKHTLFIAGALILFSGILSCRYSSTAGNETNGMSVDSLVPVLSPEASMQAMRLEKGFSVKLVASEPLINTPVAMAFDDSLRLWVVEMSDYHPVRNDSAQPYPPGKVVILSDTDGDGVMDKSKVFMDSLAMPRAICMVAGGILLAIPPDLWYIPVVHDRPGKKILVDADYAVSNNPEGQTNGLLYSVDNWIYSAGFGSHKRYRRINGHWHIEETRARGQWGISQDNYGRLFYNNNSQNLLGDYLLPEITGGNKYQKKMAGFNEKIVADNRVYPAGPTPAVNRGYRPGILDDSRRLVHFTAACGPLIYRGGLFPGDYEGNAFVCEPAANLIKRNILEHDGLKISGKQAYRGREFLSSTDKRFRPVSLYNGPDGALYIIDMYRGVIQDNLSLTDYLKNYSIEHGLDHPVNCGRIYKIIPAGSRTRSIKIPDDPVRLAGLLTNKNGWVRDRAQQKLVGTHALQAVPFLRKLLGRPEPVTAKIQALWTLEGLRGLKENDIRMLLKEDNIHIRIQALTALGSLLDKHNYEAFLPVIEHLLPPRDSLSAPCIAYVLNKLAVFAPGRAGRLREALIRACPSDIYVIDAIINGLEGKEESYTNKYEGSSLFHHRLDMVIKNKSKLKKDKDMAVLKKEFPEGYAVFEGTCQTCHGADGNGIKFVAPPLNGSEWVTGDKNKLIPIVLFGLSGPVNVGGKVYKKPEVTGEMPGFGNNNKFTDKEIAAVLSFIRNAWSNKAKEIREKDIRAVRRKYRGREESFTMKELLKGH